MPKYTPSDDELDDSAYGEKPGAAKATVTTDTPEKPSVDEENAGETALVSNKILSPEGEPLKAGDEIVLQVVKNYGDECEVKYAPHKEGENETDETTTPEQDFAAMDQQKA